ncbi:MAG: hypothetical protein ACTHW1_00450 [Ancrocorticia sp.]|uniref:hypothetical protein n=1 Tax=Ancrocorticia sp. TaxID=2593684 RepID=UPI003F900D0D
MAGVLLPAALLLSACQSANTVEITEDGGMTMTMDMVDTTGMMADSGITCDMMQSEVSGEGDDLIPGGSFDIEDISEGSNLGCRFIMSTPDAVDGEVLIDNGDSFTLNITADDMDMEDFTDEDLEELGGLDFTFNVTMPGEITDATNGGSISGSTVSYSDYNILSSGISVTGAKSGGGGGGAPAPAPAPSQGQTVPDPVAGTPVPGPGADGNTTDSQNSDSDGFPIWAWILIGVGAVLLIGLIIFFLTRGKKNKNDGGYPGGPGQPPYGQTPYGQPGQPQAGYGQPAPGQAPYGQPTQQFGQPDQSGQGGQPTQQFGQPGQPTQQFGQPQPGQQGGQPTQQFGQPQPGQEGQPGQNGQNGGWTQQ